MLFCTEDKKIDIGKCIKFSILHDLAEVIVGDITPHDGILSENKY
jgi:putative hydrolase of HD superfamily